MISQDMLRFRKVDLLAVAFVILLAVMIAIGYLPEGSGGACRAEIYQNGNLLQVVSLDEDAEFRVEADYLNVIQVRDGRIAIVESDCPGMDCVHSGFAGTPNRSIVCLPNGVEIRLTADEAEVDFVVR